MASEDREEFVATFPTAYRSKHPARQSLFSAVIGGIVVILIGLVQAPHLIDLFGVQTPVHRLGTYYIRIIFIGTLPVAPPFLTAALTFAIPSVFDTRVCGIWIAIVLSDIAQAKIVTYVFLYGAWKKKIV